MELIKRLRVQAHENPVSLADLLSLCREAADAIENLQTENAALRRQIDNLTSAQAMLVKEFDKKLEELHEAKSELDAAVRGQETLQKALAALAGKRGESHG